MLIVKTAIAGSGAVRVAVAVLVLAALSLALAVSAASVVLALATHAQVLAIHDAGIQMMAMSSVMSMSMMSCLLMLRQIVVGAVLFVSKNHPNKSHQDTSNHHYFAHG